MSLLTLVVALVLVGIGLWLINRAPFIDGTVKQIITWVVIAFVVIWILGELGLWASVGNIRIGR